MAGVIGGENDRTFDVAQVFEPTHGGGGNQARGRSGQIVHDHGSGQASGVAARPIMVVLESDLALGIGPLHGGGPRRSGQREAYGPRPAEQDRCARVRAPAPAISGRPPS